MKLLILAASLAALGACKKSGDVAQPTQPTPTAEAPAPTEGAPAQGRTATATLAPTQGSQTTGTVTFREIDGGVEITASLAGLSPGEHGFHVHEKGDCSAPDASSAGSHYNPTGQPHGAPDAAQHHAGDFGNVTAGADGTASKTLVMEGVTLGEGDTSLAGKAVIVHEKRDDLTSQPTGDAGGRLACGVIQLDP